MKRDQNFPGQGFGGKVAGSREGIGVAPIGSHVPKGTIAESGVFGNVPAGYPKHLGTQTAAATTATTGQPIPVESEAHPLPREKREG